MSWRLLSPEEITDEDRRIMADLCEEERRERSTAFWKVYPDDTEEDGGEYHEPDV